MILKDIYLYPSLVDYPVELTIPFRDQTRSVCNYLERQLKPLKYNTAGFKRICFIGKMSAAGECYINSSKVLTVEVNFDDLEYKKLSDDQLNFYFINLIKSGINNCKGKMDIPEKELLCALEDFSLVCGNNSWIFKSRSIKSLGLKCELVCRLSIHAFHLVLIISKDKEIIFNKEILRTEPNELVFAHKFKDIIVEKNEIFVIDKFERPIFSVKVNQLKS